jgi:hypothetical protein
LRGSFLIKQGRKKEKEGKKKEKEGYNPTHIPSQSGLSREDRPPITVYGIISRERSVP